MGDEVHSDEQPAIDRRGILLRGGAVLAGLAGASAAGLAAASPASAAPGEPVLQGGTAAQNNAGAAMTALTSSNGDATLDLHNTGAGALLRLRETDFPAETSQSGDVFNLGGDFVVTHLADPDFGPVVGSIYTTAWATMTVPIDPERVIDTRDAAFNVRIFAPAGSRDSAGRVLKGKWIGIDLIDFVDIGTAIYGNVTVTQPAAAGWVALTPNQPTTTPTTSTVNFAAGQTVGNFAVCGIGFTDTRNDVVYIYAKETTHVILDATAFVVNDPFQVLAGGGFEAQQQQRLSGRQAKAAQRATELRAARG